MPQSERKVFVPAMLGEDEKHAHTVFQNPYPSIPIGRNKKDRKKKEVEKNPQNIESLVRPDEANRYFTDLNDVEPMVRSQSSMQRSSIANLVDGVNLLPPLNQEEVEAIYLSRRQELQSELQEAGLMEEQIPIEIPEHDAYMESFIVHEQKTKIDFPDPMMAAYTRIAESKVEDDEPQNDERKVLSDETRELYRIESGKRAANFDFPNVPIGKRGLKKEKKTKFNDDFNFNLRSATASNVLSLIPASERDETIIGTFHDDYQIEIDKANKEKEVSPKKIKSKLGPILNPEDIGFERAMITGPGEKKVIETVAQENPENTEIPEIQGITSTGTGDEIQKRLRELMEASGQKQAEIERIKLNNVEKAEGLRNPTEISIDTSKVIPVEKKSSTKKKKKDEKSEFTLEETILKDEVDEKIIEVNIPDSIKKFGKSKS